MNVIIRVVDGTTVIACRAWYDLFRFLDAEKKRSGNSPHLTDHYISFHDTGSDTPYLVITLI